MLSTIRSLGCMGVGGYAVTVECYVSQGLPGFDIVGLPDAAVKEARERVRSAIKNNGMKYPVSRVTVNLAPADKRKAGTLYDLPVLLGILAATGDIKQPPRTAAFFGELSLAGELRGVPGALTMAREAQRLGLKELYVPAENAAEAAFAEGITVYGVSHVRELIAHLRGDARLTPASPPEIGGGETAPLDFYEVRGQYIAKRALEISAAGGHNLLMIGPPGSGKSMLAKRLPTILPAMTREEMLSTTQIHSVAGLTSSLNPIVARRPFRAPHHTLSDVAMCGGGTQLRPGEISLAHNGVLFLDEFPEFGHDVIESMRQPTEDGVITISRASGSVTYPAEFMLVGAMNPCRCGWYGDKSGRCTCSRTEVERYQKRISGPMLNRFDLIIELRALPFSELSAKPNGESSADIRARVEAARAIQHKRYQNSATTCNARMNVTEIMKYCHLDEEQLAFMSAMYHKLGLTARSYDRARKVARTLADMDERETIEVKHLAEALQYRSYDIDRGI